MDLSICILTHNQPELLPLCVASCVAEIRKAQVQGEIIIVDNASCDRYPQRLATMYSQVMVIRNEQNLGFSTANNGAIRQSRGHNILILNDDALLQNSSLKLMLQKLESDPQIGAVGPKLLNPDGSVQRGFSNKRIATLRCLISETLYLNTFFDKWRLTRRVLTRLKNDDISGGAAEIAGACLLIRREALDAVGLFDETFYYWFEDTDLCYRLRRAGWKLFYLAEARATHYGSASLRKLEKLQRSMMFYESQMHFLKKHWKSGRYKISKTILILIFALRTPIAFVYRLWRYRGNLEEAKNSARVSLRIAHWLITDCD